MVCVCITSKAATVTQRRLSPSLMCEENLGQVPQEASLAMFQRGGGKSSRSIYPRDLLTCRPSEMQGLQMPCLALSTQARLFRQRTTTPILVCAVCAALGDLKYLILTCQEVGIGLYQSIFGSVDLKSLFCDDSPPARGCYT